MNRLRVLGLALVAVFAMSAVVASAASAHEPEFSTFGVCQLGPVAGVWKWANNTCTTAAVPAFTGDYAMSPFTSTSGEALLETKGGSKVKCTADKNYGELTGARTDRATVIFTGCKAEGILPCSTTGANAEEIVIHVASKLVYIKHTAPIEVGEDLSPESGTTFVTFTCSGSIIGPVEEVLTVRGSAIGSISPIDEPTNKFELSFVQSKGVQKHTEYEEEVGGTWKKTSDFLETEGKGKGIGSKTFSFEQSAEATEDTLTTTEVGEITT